MLAIERKNAILSKLMQQGKVIVSDLSREFGVTEETIRRDLEKLDNDGFAKKTYGGAVRNESLNLDLPLSVRKQTNVSGKQYIASIIGSMVEDGDYLMLDASSTALYVVKNILHKKKITVITNSIEILLELSNKTDWTVLSTGGTLKEGGLSLLGYQAERMIAGYHVDMAVCSCKGIDFEKGITDSNERDAEVKKALWASADRKVLAVDNTKFDKISFAKIADLNQIDRVVTDMQPSERWMQQFAASGIEVFYE